MRRVLYILIAGALVAALIPATALGRSHHRRHHHHARAHHGIRHKQFGRGDAPAAPSMADNAGTVASFDGTKLTIQLADGSMVSGTVNNDTEIGCEGVDMSQTSLHRDDEGRDHSGGDDNSGQQDNNDQRRQRHGELRHQQPDARDDRPRGRAEAVGCRRRLGQGRAFDLGQLRGRRRLTARFDRFVDDRRPHGVAGHLRWTGQRSDHEDREALAMTWRLERQGRRCSYLRSSTTRT